MAWCGDDIALIILVHCVIVCLMNLDSVSFGYILILEVKVQF